MAAGVDGVEDDANGDGGGHDPRDSYTVVLDSQTTANVTVTVAGHDGPTDVSYADQWLRLDACTFDARFRAGQRAQYGTR